MCILTLCLSMCQLHLHSGTDAVLNVTFIRAPSSALLKVDVPLVFRGEDVCPGLKQGMKHLCSNSLPVVLLRNVFILLRHMPSTKSDF